MNILLLTSHSIAEYDDLRMLTDLGYDVFSIGAYTDPSKPGDDKRPALDAPTHPDLELACHVQRDKHAGEDASRAIDWAKADLHPEIIDWADAIIVHHFPETWIGGQWANIRHKRVIWRTCGQSDPRLEAVMGQYDGLQIVRYSPNEQKAFERTGAFAGVDALIRFGKYPSDYGGYTGDLPVVGNVTQNMKQRGDSCGYGTWLKVTDGLPVKPAGPGSEEMGGTGSLTYPGMLGYLRDIRVYLYTGTQPASYTLGLMEAMLIGVPVVPVRWDTGIEWLDTLYEADTIVPSSPVSYAARQFLEACLRVQDFAASRGADHRRIAQDMFGVQRVGPQWREFLG